MVANDQIAMPRTGPAARSAHAPRSFTLPLCHSGTLPLLAACGLALLATPGCVREEVVGYRPSLLGTLAESQSQTPITLDDGRARPGARDGQATDGSFDYNKLRQVHDDGKVTLIARRPYHLMVHIYYTLINNEPDLFAEQVLSELTREEFEARGRDPREAFEMIQARQAEVLKLFAAMPQGELTPGVLMDKVGPTVYRLEAVGSSARRLNWRFMDVTMEGGHWKLRWFGG